MTCATEQTFIVLSLFVFLEHVFFFFSHLQTCYVSLYIISIYHFCVYASAIARAVQSSCAHAATHYFFDCSVADIYVVHER